MVGLAAAAALARGGASVLLIERREALAREITARNSEVIHSGIYYPAGSQKARLCVEGRERLYARCERLGIPHRRLGKWIVAVDAAERAQLEALCARGTQNGAPGLRMLEGAALGAEPHVRCVAALESPSTGIVDAHALCLSLAAEAESCGAALVLHTEVEGIERAGSGYRVATRDAAGERSAVACGAVVNAAGLDGDSVAARAGIDVEARGYRIHPLQGRLLLAGAGRAAALRAPRLSGAGRPGSRRARHARPRRARALRARRGVRGAPALRRRSGEGRRSSRRPRRATCRGCAPSGWRRTTPACGRSSPDPGVAFRDFVVQEESEAGLPGFVNLIGIESPGLTAALAIGERVAGMLAGV